MGADRAAAEDLAVAIGFRKLPLIYQNAWPMADAHTFAASAA